MMTFKQQLLAATAAVFIASPAAAQDLMAYEDQSAIVLSGAVGAVDDDEFTLNYGDGIVTVEMNEWDWFRDNEDLLNVGDQVVVSGQVDDDLFEGREIEADNVYLVNDSQYYYGDQTSAQPVYYFYAFDTMNRQNQAQSQAGQTGTMASQQGQQNQQQAATTAQAQTWVSAIGTVRNVQGDRFTLDAGDYNLTVNAQGVTGPSGDVAQGEKVYISGMLDQNFFSNRSIDAQNIITLAQDQGRMRGQATGRTMQGQPTQAN